VLLQRGFVEEAVVDAMGHGGRGEPIPELTAGVVPAMAQQLLQAKLINLRAPDAVGVWPGGGWILGRQPLHGHTPVTKGSRDAQGRRSSAKHQDIDR